MMGTGWTAAGRLAGGLFGARGAGVDEVPVTPVEIEGRESQCLHTGQLAGALFICAAVASLPAAVVDRQPAPFYLLTSLAVISGLLCLSLPWHRMSTQGLNLAVAAATLEVALVVWLGDPSFAWYYLLVAVYAGYAIRSPSALAADLTLISLAMLAPLLYEPEAVRATIVPALIGIPTLVTAAALVSYLRGHLEGNERVYRRLATTDALTGVGNYRALQEYLRQEVGRHKRHGRTFTLVTIDVDNFKTINDLGGHLFGDHVLQEVGRALAGSVRVQDLVARQGGDEFAVIAPDTHSQGAARLAERIEAVVGEIVGADRPLVASTGWAVFPDDGQAPDELLRQADEAMRARRSERVEAVS
jgi:diguanylate cyclase (GGDEF)-like protein